MHSKFLPWDFFQKFSNKEFGLKNGIYSILCEDPFLLHLIKEKYAQNKNNRRVFLGTEINTNFIEEHFVNLSLFSIPLNLLILQAELIPVESLEFLYERVEINADDLVFILFSKAPKPIMDILKKSKIATFEIEAPRFWEGAKLLTFCMREMKLNLNNEVQKFLLDNLEHNFESIYQALELIKLNFADRNPNLNELSNLIVKERLDFFEILPLYHKNSNEFFSILAQKEHDHDWLRQFFMSMSGHIVKLLHPEEILKKDKLTKYDQDVIRWSEKSDRKLLKEDLDLFAKLEIMAKSKNEFLKDQLRLKIKRGPIS